MADKRISDLPELTEPTGEMEFVVNDAGVSRKITRANIFRADISGLDVDGNVTVAGDVTLTGQISAADSTLDAIDASLTGDARDIFIYDTPKDSDGGAWRNRTQHTSWYNEALNSNTRGSRKEFPAVAVIVAEAGKVTIYDADDSSLPMWMVFSNQSMVLTRTDNKVEMLNSVFCVTDDITGIKIINFIEDAAIGHRANGQNTFQGTWIGNIATRNDGSEQWDGVPLSPTIITSSVYDVAITALPNALIDPATGIQTPTIAVATRFGASVIKDDGTITNISSVGRAIAVDLDGDSLLLATGYAAYKYNTIPTANTNTDTADVVIAVSTAHASFNTLRDMIDEEGEFITPERVEIPEDEISTQDIRILDIPTDIIIHENITDIVLNGDEIDIIGSGTGLNTWATSADTTNPVGITVSSAGGVTIDWGDGSEVESFGTGFTTLEHTYTSPAGNALSIVGEGIAQIRCTSNQVTGSIPEVPVGVVNFFCQVNQLTGSIPDLGNNINLVDFNCGVNQLTGSIPDLSNNVNLGSFTSPNNQLTSYAGGTIPTSLLEFFAQSNSLPEATIDALLQAFVTAGHSGTEIQLDGNVPPSTAGLANKVILEGRGWAVTTDV